jgi:hypothetical protein
LIARSRISIVGEHAGQKVLAGRLVRHLALLHELNQLRQPRRGQAERFHRDPALVRVAPDVALDPVGREFGRATRLDDPLVVVRQAALAAEIGRVVGGESVLVLEAGAPRGGQLRDARLRLFSPRFADVDRRDVRLGEVAVVVRLFLVAHDEHAIALVVVAERAARHGGDVRADLLVGVHRALDLLPHGALDVAHRVQVLDLVDRRLDDLVAIRDVHVHVRLAAQIALRHVAVADAEVVHQGAQRVEVRARFLRRVHVGLGDDLDERRPGAVEVDARQPLFVHALADVLLDVDAADADVLDAAFGDDLERAVDRQRPIELADLVALGEIGVEVVLAIELGQRRDLAAHRGGERERHEHRVAVRDGQRAGHAEADRAAQGVRRCAVPHRTAAEHLALGAELEVDLHADERLGVHALYSEGAGSEGQVRGGAVSFS